MIPKVPVDLIQTLDAQQLRAFRSEILSEMENFFLRTGRVFLVAGTRLPKLPLEDQLSLIAEIGGLLDDYKELVIWAEMLLKGSLR